MVLFKVFMKLKTKCIQFLAFEQKLKWYCYCCYGHVSPCQIIAWKAPMVWIHCHIFSVSCLLLNETWSSNPKFSSWKRRIASSYANQSPQHQKFHPTLTETLVCYVHNFSTVDMLFHLQIVWRLKLLDIWCWIKQKYIFWFICNWILSKSNLLMGRQTRRTTTLCAQVYQKFYSTSRVAIFLDWNTLISKPMGERAFIKILPCWTQKTSRHDFRGKLHIRKKW